MNNKKPGAIQRVLLILSALILFIAQITAFALFHKETISSQVIKFNLVDHENVVATEKNFSGKWALIYFGFTNCAKACPVQMSVMKGLLAELDKSDHSEMLIPILVTVDPERDTPEVMRKYLAHFDSRIVGLTGADKEIQTLLKSLSAFSFQMKKNNDSEYEVIHPDFFYLIDPTGRINQQIAANQDTAQLVSYLRNEFQTFGEAL